MAQPTNSSPHKIKTPAPGELTPRDDIKKQVSDILRRVDQLIRHGDLNHAKLELENAKGLDPRNVYAMAFEERISNLLEQESAGKNAEDTKKRMEEQALRRVEEARREEEEKLKAEEARRKTEEAKERLRREAESVIPKSQPIPVDKSAIMEALQQEEAKRLQTIALAVPQPQHSTPAPNPSSVSGHDDDLRIYREYLDQAWADGIPTAEERKQMDQLRAVMSINGDEHARLEQESRLHCYNIALRRAVMGSRSGPNSTAHVQLRKLFAISDAEHQEIETKMIADLKKNKKKPSVVIIDDDVRLLELLAQAITHAGFEAVAVPTSDEAFALMRKLRPDLILCDINLETSTMGGFTFYEKVQEVPHLQDVPFVFLTGLSDEVLVRAGKELGVDDYLMKPISEQLLVSTLRGKLKRYRQLRAALPQSSAA